MPIEAILKAINANGTQGPQDLTNMREYGWVKKTLDIEYDDYLHLLLRHTIDESDRSVNRNAYLIRDSKGRIKRFKTTEDEIRNLVCYVISLAEGQTSREIIKRVKLLYSGATPCDLMLQEKLNSPQQVIDQIIRNILVSNYEKASNSALIKRINTTPYTYSLTYDGTVAAAEIAAEDLLTAAGGPFAPPKPLPAEDSHAGAVQPYTETELKAIARRNRDFKATPMENALSLTYKTDPRLAQTAKEMAAFCCQIDPNHPTFTHKSGEKYVESHHLIPMAAQKNFENINLDSLENLVALCPNCHRAIHVGDDATRARLAKSLFAKRRTQLQKIGLTRDIQKDVAFVFYGCKL